MADIKFAIDQELPITIKNSKGDEVTSKFWNTSGAEVTIKETDFKISVRDGKEGAFLVCTNKAVERVPTAMVNIGFGYSYLTRKGMSQDTAANVATEVENQRTAQYRK